MPKLLLKAGSVDIKEHSNNLNLFSIHFNLKLANGEKVTCFVGHIVLDGHGDHFLCYWWFEIYFAYFFLLIKNILWEKIFLCHIK